MEKKIMPLWKIYTPAGAYSQEDKEAMSEVITGLYAQIPIPKFYVVTVFEEVAEGDCFVGGVKHSRFVRFRVDHMARTLPGPILREWWVRTVDKSLKPWVGDRGFDWEVSIDETPFDLWSLQGEIPPPFESIAEKRWVEENKPSSYTADEKLPAGTFLLGPGVTDHPSLVGVS
jgi:phenylpyruvate tautomerase PptA (4-oxalocrotonate tautomerase family)